MLRLVWAESSWEDYQSLLENDKRAVKKINSFIKELRRTGNPANGEGSPEPLKGDRSGWWSRRINEKDRLVYQITNDSLIIAQCHGHYNDK